VRAGGRLEKIIKNWLFQQRKRDAHSHHVAECVILLLDCANSSIDLLGVIIEVKSGSGQSQ
jgi:hypothetical protein